MICRHCGKQITFAFDTSREWVHDDTGNVECWINGAPVGTSADPKDKDTWEEDE